MEEKHFMLQHRYEVRPTANAVIDTTNETEVKVEPRLMKLLCILARQKGQLVKREHLVSEIWNDYGGGEAGLNHAISTLRKVLNDTSKELIETIPTKGYILHAEISEMQTAAKQKANAPKRSSKSIIIYSSAIVAAGLAAYLFFQFQGGKKVETMSSSNKNLNVPFSEVNKKAAETWLNTITTTGDDGTEYKLKAIGDSRPEFYINGRLLSPDEMEQHLDLIRNLKKQLEERGR